MERISLDGKIKTVGTEPTCATNPDLSVWPQIGLTDWKLHYEDRVMIDVTKVVYITQIKN